MDKKTSELLTSIRSKKNYDDFLKEEYNNMYFESIDRFLESMLSVKGITKSEAVKKSGLEKGYAYQIFNGIKENPSRDKLLCLAIAMGLDFEEVKKLMKIAKLPELYVRDPRDSIIIFAIENHFDMIKTNILLHEHNKDLLE